MINLEVPSTEHTAKTYDGNDVTIKLHTSVTRSVAKKILAETIGQCQYNIKGDTTIPLADALEMRNRFEQAIWHKDNPSMDDIDFEQSDALVETIKTRTEVFQSRINL